MSRKETNLENVFGYAVYILMIAFSVYMLFFGGCQSMLKDMVGTKHSDYKTGKIKTVDISFDDGFRFDIEYYGYVSTENNSGQNSK